jgi:hypothetical protein
MSGRRVPELQSAVKNEKPERLLRLLRLFWTRAYATVRSFPGKKWYGGQGPLTEISQFFSCLAALE